MLDLRRLRVFREVSDRGSFSEAALSSGYTQSAVSHQIAQLERELGMTLFERGRRPVRLTPAGERLREHADSLLGAAAVAEEDMRSLAGLETGLLRVGAFLTACASFMPKAIGDFMAGHPGVKVELRQEEPYRSLPGLIAGDLDLAVVFQEHDDPAEADPRLDAAVIREDAYRIVVHPQHRLARRRELTLADLADERFVAPRPEGGGLKYRSMIERLCADAGFAPDFAFSVEDVTIARAFVAAGLGIAVMPDMTIGRPRPDVVVKPIRGFEPFRTIEVRWVGARKVAGIEEMTAALQAAA